MQNATSVQEIFCRNPNNVEGGDRRLMYTDTERGRKKGGEGDWRRDTNVPEPSSDRGLFKALPLSLVITDTLGTWTQF